MGLAIHVNISSFGSKYAMYATASFIRMNIDILSGIRLSRFDYM